MIKSHVLATVVPRTLGSEGLLRSMTCVIINGGHELYVVRGDAKSGKVYQQCVNCGHKTKGWEL